MGASSDVGIGAGLGSAIGSVIPGIGTVIGGAIGAVGGFIMSLLGHSGYDVVQSQLPNTPYYQNTISYRRSFDTQAEHDAYVASVWAEYKQYGPNGPLKAYGQTIGAMVQASSKLFAAIAPQVPRHAPLGTPPRVYPGGSPRGNGGQQSGPQPTPPSTHFPGGARLRKKRRVRTKGLYAHHRHASAHL